MFNWILRKLGLCKLKTATNLREDGDRLMRINAILETKNMRLKKDKELKDASYWWIKTRTKWSMDYIVKEYNKSLEISKNN